LVALAHFPSFSYPAGGRQLWGVNRRVSDAQIVFGSRVDLWVSRRFDN
jgi:hypothetical protein